MSDKLPENGSPEDKYRPLPRIIVVDCSDWEPDIPPEKCSRGQFITDRAIIAKHLEEKEAREEEAGEKKAREKEADPPASPHG